MNKNLALEDQVKVDQLENHLNERINYLLGYLITALYTNSLNFLLIMQMTHSIQEVPTT